MHPSRLLREAYRRQPMIKFLGKRVPPSACHCIRPSASQLTVPSENITPSAPADEPAPHPASSSDSLPDSFIKYRSKAQQHGPLAGHKPPSSSPSSSSAPSASPHVYGDIGGHSGHELGKVEPAKGQVWDRKELPRRFARMAWTEEEMEAVEMGGAGVKVGWGGS